MNAIARFLKSISGESEELKRSKEELNTIRLLLTSAREQKESAENQLRLVSGDYEKRLAVTYGQLNQAASGIDKVLSMFPYIEDVNSLMERMSPEDFKKLDLPFGAEFQAGMTQLAGQKMEAVVKLNEAGLRLALGMHFLKMTGATIAPNTKFVAELLVQLRDLLIEYAPLMKLPAFKQIFAESIATNLAKISAASRNGEEPPATKLVDLVVQSIDEFYAEVQADIDKVEDLPKSPPTQHVPASDEVLYTAPPADSREFDNFYDVSPQPSANGNGQHKKVNHGK